MSVRVAVDIGGTFTDATLIDEETGRVAIAKVLDDAGRPVRGLHGGGRARARRGRRPRAADVGFVVHATTVATNAIIEGKIARSGFVTTDGFRDLLEIARQVRPTLYDTQFEKPRPLVPRDRAVGVVERLGPTGEVLTPLDDGLGARGGRGARATQDVESVAVCLLHSYVNPEHERRVGAILAEELPGRPGLALGRGRARVPRVPARVDDRDQRRDPAGRRALPRAASRAGSPRPGIDAKLLVMQSSGGVFSSEAARAAAGVHGRVRAGGRRDRRRPTSASTIGLRDVLSFDMGGTTAKVGLIQDGRPSVTKDY